MQSLYKPFWDLLPSGGSILDAGCGSGRDSKAFMDLGYHVTSIDASQRMVAATTQLTGQQALQMRLQDLSFLDNFDGIWACASLVHVPIVELPVVLKAFAQALHPSGVCYVSLKDGKGERCLNGRRFTDMDEECFTELVAGIIDLKAIRIWHTNDLRADRCDKWLNILLQRMCR